MNAIELKEYIIKNDKTPVILEAIGCHSITEYSSEYRSALPDKNNKTSVTVKKESLYSAVYSGDINMSGDIFALVMELKGISFGKAMKFIHETLGLEYKFDKKEKTEKVKTDLLDIFKKIKRRTAIVNRDIEVYGDDILKEYTPLPHISWVREGILPFACDRFKIGYSYDKKRIIIPHHYWCGSDNEYVGIVGRTTIPNHDILGIPKYFGIKPFKKSMNVYGLYENYKTIQEAGYVVVFEAEKSVLKRYSRKDGTATAIGSHTLSDEQVKILMGLNVDIVIAYDEGIDIKDIYKDCEKFYGVRNIYFIYNKWGLLNEKESPADKPDKQYKFMLKHKIKYDETKHKEWLNCLKENPVKS